MNGEREINSFEVKCDTSLDAAPTDPKNIYTLLHVIALKEVEMADERRCVNCGEERTLMFRCCAACARRMN